MWDIKGKVSTGKKYDNAIVPDHPKADKNGYVAYHRVVAENALGRMLSDKEVVHHINNDGKDNRPVNLQVMSNEAHISLHVSQRGRKYVILKCPNCKQTFEKPQNKTHLCGNGKRGTYTACSRYCSGMFSKEYTKDKRSAYAESALKENVVKEYTRYP